MLPTVASFDFFFSAAASSCCCLSCSSAAFCAAADCNCWICVCSACIWICSNFRRSFAPGEVSRAASSSFFIRSPIFACSTSIALLLLEVLLLAALDPTALIIAVPSCHIRHYRIQAHDSLELLQ